MTKAFPVDGGPAVPLCAGHCYLIWDMTGRSTYLIFPELFTGTFEIPVMQNTGLPKIPPGGIERLADLPNPKTSAQIPWQVESVISHVVYAYTRENTRRNLYRIQLP